MLYPPGFYFVKKPKRFVILSSDKSSEGNLSSFFDIKKTRRIEHLQKKEPFSSDPYFTINFHKYLENIQLHENKNALLERISIQFHNYVAPSNNW